MSFVVCGHMSSGVFMLLGSREFPSMEVIKSYTKMFWMPYITTSIPFDIAGYYGYEIYMKPKVVHALRDMVAQYQWTMIHYIYESESGMFYIVTGCLQYYQLWINLWIVFSYLSKHYLTNLTRYLRIKHHLLRMIKNNTYTNSFTIYKEQHKNILPICQLPQIDSNRANQARSCRVHYKDI